MSHNEIGFDQGLAAEMAEPARRLRGSVQYPTHHSFNARTIGIIQVRFFIYPLPLI